MPRPPNLDNCIIYHIREIESRHVAYVGATTNFTKRKCKHKSSCNTVSNKDYNTPIYAHIRETGGWHLYEMIPVLHFTCGNIMELHIAEQQEIDRHTDLFNAKYAVRSKAQYRADNRDKIAQYHQQYRADNKDVLAEYQQQYHKQYYDENKDKIAEYQQQYQIKNRDARAAKAAVKLTCECGCVVAKSYIVKHQKSAKHKKLFEQLDQASYEPIALLAIAQNV